MALYSGGKAAADGRATAARASLLTIRDACLGTAELPGFRTDLRELPRTIRDLYAIPASLPSGAPVQPWDRYARRGWNGPYLRSPSGRYSIDPPRGFGPAYGAGGDPAVADPWGHPIVLQRPTTAGLTPEEAEAATRLVSAGPDGILETSPNVPTPDPGDPGQVGDDIVIYLLRETG